MFKKTKDEGDIGRPHGDNLSPLFFQLFQNHAHIKAPIPLIPV
jgi:hypothetical protein